MEFDRIRYSREIIFSTYRSFSRGGNSVRNSDANSSTCSGRHPQRSRLRSNKPEIIASRAAPEFAIARREALPGKRDVDGILRLSPSGGGFGGIEFSYGTTASDTVGIVGGCDNCVLIEGSLGATA